MTITGNQFREARQRAGLSYRKAAERLGCSVRTIQLWEQRGDQPVPDPDRATLLSDPADAIRDDAHPNNKIAYTMGEIAALVEHATGEALPRTLWLYGARNPAVGIAKLMQWYHRPNVDRSSTDDAVIDLMATLPRDLPTGLVDTGAFEVGYYQRRAKLR